MSAAAPARSNFQLRVMSAIVLAIVVLTLTWAGGIWYRLLAAVIGAAVLYEWATMAGAGRVQRLVLYALLAVVLALLLAGTAVTTILLVLLGAVVIASIHAGVEKSGFSPVIGLGYAGLCAIALAALRGNDAAGLSATLFLFAVVWTTDIAAYFVGRTFGGPKLAPSISPGKTWSGAIGGTVGAIITGIAVAMAYGTIWSWAALFVLVLALSAISQIGDLYESSLKRRFGVKDSSQLIPGHGGVMDRVDGLAAAAFVLFLVGALAASPDAPAHALFTR